jgi:hypothetical protein
MSQQGNVDRDGRPLERTDSRTSQKKHLKHHRNLSDSLATHDIEEDDFFYETKEKFHRGR